MKTLPSQTSFVSSKNKLPHPPQELASSPRNPGSTTANISMSVFKTLISDSDYVGFIKLTYLSV